MKKGFTLIELLVVVLIIGILSAVALPQYTKAVWKSRAAQLQVMVKSLADAQKVFILANGTYANNFSSLDIGFDSLPQKPTSPSNNLSILSTDSVRKNNEMELVINSGNISSWFLSTALFSTGPYSGCGFMFIHSGKTTTLTENTLYCVEYETTTAGNFCHKVMGLTSTPITTLNYRYYHQ